MRPPGRLRALKPRERPSVPPTGRFFYRLTPPAVVSGLRILAGFSVFHNRRRA